MGQRKSDNTLPSEVEVPMMYLIDTGKAPVFHQTDTPADEQIMEGAREEKLMKIQNARVLETNFSLHEEGFALAEKTTSVNDFYDDSELSALYTPELEDLLVKVTGGSEAVVYDHTRRSTVIAHREKHNARNPVALPHSDYTDASARQRMRDVFGDEAEEKIKKRFSIVNAWRSIAGTIEQWPLAVCDARTINDKFMHMVERRAPHREEPSFEYARSSETQHASFDPNHRWYYFAHMTNKEVLLFKNYETELDGTARYALHSAFEDPSSPLDASARQSIESRAFIFYD